MDRKLYSPFYDKNVTTYPHKYSVVVLNDKKKPRLIHFGDRRYEHYHDKLGVWKRLDHGDAGRRANYLARSAPLSEKNDKNSANYWARKVLW